MKKTVLMTGSGGFIGSHLKKHLSDYELLTPRSNELNLLDGNAVDSYFAVHKIDAIVHLASVGVRINSDATMDKIAEPNVRMFQNLAKHATNSCAMIVTGSGAEYDKCRDIRNVSESDFGLSIPKDPYGYSKYLISKEIEERDYVLNLRVFGVYGANEHTSRVTTYAICQNLEHQPIRLKQDALFDFIYIDDLCKVIAYFLEHQTTQKFINVTPSESIRIVDIAKIVNEISDWQSEIKVEHPGMNKEYTGDNSLLLHEMPTLTFTSYENGLKSLYQEMKNENR